MSALGSSETATRAWTGAVFVLVVMVAVAWSAWSNALLWATVAALAWFEWHKAPPGPCHEVAQSRARPVSCASIGGLGVDGRG